jgi:hypothetical protein
MSVESFLTTIATAGGTSLALSYLVSLLLSSRLKHEYDKKLEAHKASLTQQYQTVIERLKHELQENSTGAKEQLEADRTLYGKFVDTMPSTGCIEQIGNANFQSAFSQTMFKDLRDFHRGWNNAQHEFMDKDIEAARTQLYELIIELFDFVTQYSSQIKDDVYEIPKVWENMPRSYSADLVRSANRMCRRIYDSHQTLIRTAKTKLRV